MRAARPCMGMKRLPAVLVLMLALAVPAVGATASPSPTAVAAGEKECRTGFSEARAARFVRVSGVSCAKGRSVARRVAARAPSGCVKFTDKRHVTLIKPCVRAGFRCTARALAKGLALEATCSSHGKTVKFQY
jgi:hypothetical protein